LRRLFLLAAAMAILTASPAHASQLVDRDASNVKLAVNAKGEALLTYNAGEALKHVLAWGAVNAIAPASARQQVAFSLDYAGGYGKYHRDYWKTFGTDCGPYDGPPLGWLVTACKAPDGSYWAVQAWQRALPDYGTPASPVESAWELHLSHWTGAIAVLTIKEDWSYRRFDHLYGSLTYDGAGVYGFRSTHGGAPLDSFGRNVYVDTFGSSYGAGWKRENSFLTHGPRGTFCYGFYPHGNHPTGRGTKYRATVIGPGVTPDILWQGTAPGPYDRTADLAANAEQRTAFADPACKVN
jgi:opacity protein-like surface antigen